MSKFTEDEKLPLNQQAQFKKLNKLQWNKIEKSYEDPIIKAVLDTMQKLGSENENTTDITSDVKVCGNDIYIDNRKLLFELGLIDTDTYITTSKNKNTKNKQKNKNKKATGKLSKEDMIINNTIKHVTKNLEEVIKTFSYKKYNVSYGFHSQYAEIRLITFMYAIKFWMETKPMNLAHCYELVLGIRKTLNNIHMLKNISDQAVYDLTEMYKKFVKFCDFTYATMFEKFPRLCLMTAYDTVFTNMSIKPYSSQKSLMNSIKQNIKTGGLYCYKAMIGTGKTTFAIALSEFTKNRRMVEKASGQKSKLQLLFSCSVEPVRHQVCRMAYNQQIPFGIGVKQNDTVRVINNFSCKNDDNRILIIADLETSIELLKRDQDYILFIDEPTVGADQENHPITKAVAKLLSCAPKTTILCSATLPEPEEISEMISNFQNRHKISNDVISVCSKESLIGCELINFNGSTILPHNNCKTSNELKIVIENLKAKPFIDRLYTAPVIYKLHQRLEEFGIQNIIDLENYFSDVDTLSQTNIQMAAIILLESLLKTNNDNLIKKACIPFERIFINENDIQNSPENEDDTGFMWKQEENQKEKQDDLRPYNLDNIFTSESHRYLGGCLVTVKNPYTFAFEKSKYLRENCEPASKIIDKYMLLIEKFNQTLQKLDYIKNDDERTKKQQELQNNFKPEFSFPSYFKINTNAHLKKFAKNTIVDIKNLRYNFNLENLPFDLNVPDWVMLLLFSGVGIYDPNQQLLDQRYQDLILDMTAEGKLSFLIADDNICYGANYPFSHVIIDEEIAKSHSIGTIFQLLGRAGRVGQSWVAYGHIGDETTKRIMGYIKGNELLGISDEAYNLNKSFNIVKEENIKEELKNNNIIKLSEVTPALDKSEEFSLPQFEHNKKIQVEKSIVIEQQQTPNFTFDTVDSWESLLN
ncbi:hypothetical protein Indivirus_2_103 [Indivirus ILV1]|uniref:Uncharacterized protein n=1 Tax=Indivirus ILV1 TaxID=1977633 RepID=A0A1V0SDL7_9VIRU|nr:hypothetical protein Indivirus_2_103 [Indivirus ILV1]